MQHKVYMLYAQNQGCNEKKKKNSTGKHCQEKKKAVGSLRIDFEMIFDHCTLRDLSLLSVFITLHFKLCDHRLRSPGSQRCVFQTQTKKKKRAKDKQDMIGHTPRLSGTL